MTHATTTALMILFVASFWAGTQNALAGGGSFITLPALMFTGMDAQAANITSTIALFPAQLAMGWTGRRQVANLAALSFRILVAISLMGGVLGAILLLITPPAFFARLVPFLVLFATAVFAWGSFAPKRARAVDLSRRGAMLAQFLISIYGGYFGGGIGFLMLAALTAAGMMIRSAGATKNVLAGAMNASAVAIFIFSPEVRWLQAGVASVGAVGGGVIGAVMLNRVSEKPLRVLVVLIGIALTIGLFARSLQASVQNHM
jgi:uncharacterized membrane protein YfcA